MPSDKKRINLTVPDEIYAQLQAYKRENGLESDATACLQLVVQQLKAHENGKLMMQLFRESSVEQLMQISKEGLSFVKEELSRSDK